MAKDNPPELRARAVRMVLDHAAEFRTQWTAIQSVSRELKCTCEALRRWVRAAEGGSKTGAMSSIKSDSGIE